MTISMFRSAKTILMATAIVAMAGFNTDGALAQSSNSGDLVRSLPAQIPEILTGGTWKNGDIGGVYRAVVVMSDNNPEKNLANKAAKPLPVEATGMPDRKAEVFIQWISHENGDSSPKVVKTVSIKEFNKKHLRHAFLAMDTLKDNEMTLLVTSYDDQSDKDISVSVKATIPGKVVSAKVGK